MTLFFKSLTVNSRFGLELASKSQALLVTCAKVEWSDSPKK